MNRTILALITGLCAVLGAAAASPGVRWHNEAADTTRIAAILDRACSQRWANPSARTAAIAAEFVGTPYVAHTLEGEQEVLTVNLDQLDCTTLVDVTLALSYTAGENRRGWQDFLYNLRRLRYRGGETDGYASRLHYNCDWAVDNIHRGNIADVTPQLPKCTYMVRSIDFMTANADKYPAMADSATRARIKSVESGFRNHRFPYIKTIDLSNAAVKAALRPGDVLGFVSNLKNLDITHMGILVEKDGELYVLHASSTDGLVEVSARPLADFVKRNRQWIGIRVYRLRE